MQTFDRHLTRKIFLFRKVVQSSTGSAVTKVISIDDDKPMVSDAPLPAPKTPEKMISSQLETLNDNNVIRRRSSRNLLRGRVINTNKASLRNSGLNSSKETLGSSAATIKSESPATTSQVSFSETSASETEDKSSQQNTEIDVSEGPSSVASLPQRASTQLTGSGYSAVSQSDTIEASSNSNINQSSDSIQTPVNSAPQLNIDLRRSYTNVNRAMIKKLQSTPSRANLFSPVIRKGPSLQVIANANKLSRSTTSIQIPSPRRDPSPTLESSTEKRSPRKEKDDDVVSSKVKTKSPSKEKLKKLPEEPSPRPESPASGRRIMFQDEVSPKASESSSARKTTSSEKLDLAKARRTSSNDEKLKKMIEDNRDIPEKKEKDKKDKKEKEKKSKERLDASDDIKSSRKKISTDHLIMSVDDSKISKRHKRDKSKSSKSRDLDSSLEDSSSSKVKRKSSNDDRVLSIRSDSGSRSPSPNRSRNESDLEKSSDMSSPKTPKKDSAPRSGSGSTSGSRTTSPLRGAGTSTSIELEGTPVSSLLSSVRSRSPTVDYSGPGSLTTSLEASESKSKKDKKFEKEKEKKEKKEKEKEKKEKKEKKTLGRTRATTLKISKSGADVQDPKNYRSISFEASDVKKHSLNPKFKLSRKHVKSPKHELPVILHFHGGGFLSGKALILYP